MDEQNIEAASGAASGEIKVRADRKVPQAGRATAKITATKLTFVLGLLCLATLGYAAIAFIHLSFGPLGDPVSVPYFVVRQRTALSALAMTVGITCVIMGFAVFMIEAKGEVNFRAESSFVKGALSGVPGPFFVLCGTAITLTVLLAKVSYEQGPTPPPVSTGTAATVAIPSGGASRTIASSPNQRIALYTADRAIYNNLMAVALSREPGEAHDATNYLVANEEKISIVLIGWDDEKKAPTGFQAVDANNRSRGINVSDGYLIILDGNSAESADAVLKAAAAVAAGFPEPEHLPADQVTKLLKAALTSRVVFIRGEHE